MHTASLARRMAALSTNNLALTVVYVITLAAAILGMNFLHFAATGTLVCWALPALNGLGRTVVTSLAHIACVVRLVLTTLHTRYMF